MSHPSSVREPLAEQQKHLRYLSEFEKFTGVSHVHLLTLAHAQAWVAEMVVRGWAWDSRRHALLYVRRACQMGTHAGIPNVIGDLAIDRKERRGTRIAIWSLDQLITRIIATDDDNERAALVLGGLLGCRPTETSRADIPDLDDSNVLSIGEREAKNEASVRALPVPALAAKWLRQSFGRRRTGAMVKPRGRRSGEHYTEYGLHQFLAPHLKGPPRLKPKELRKTFATWAAEVIPAKDLEHYLGHETRLRALVTERHYLKRHQVEELRPSSKKLEAAIAGAVLRLKRGKRTRTA